jgi:phosphoribosylaminoimidazole synthetase
MSGALRRMYDDDANRFLLLSMLDMLMRGRCSLQCVLLRSFSFLFSCATSCLEDYDLAGFSVGLVERSMVLPRDTLAAGDCVLGLASSGVHSNGFSLVRLLVEREKLDYHGLCPFDSNQTLGQALLMPTRIYVRSCLPLCRQGLVKAMAHITGGGLVENIPRVIPPHLAVRLDASLWPLSPVFRWLKKSGGLSNEELSRTFNCGIGMVLIVDPQSVTQVSHELSHAGESVYSIGRVIPALETDHPVVIDRIAESW